jgi:hypothetical protein
LNLDIHKLEILKFSKEPDTVPFETCIVTADGMTLNGHELVYPGLLDELEAQAARNTLTYRHSRTVEKMLSDYYDPKKEK